MSILIAIPVQHEDTKYDTFCYLGKYPLILADTGETILLLLNELDKEEQTYLSLRFGARFEILPKSVEFLITGELNLITFLKQVAIARGYTPYENK